MVTPVLVTRAAPDGEAFASLCGTRGLAPVLAPVMRIDIARKKVDLDGVAALAFTSANGVRAFAENCQRRDLPVYAVGAVTAAAAQAAGFLEVAAADGDVESLAARIAGETALIGHRVLHVAGADRAGDLTGMLAAQGVAARRLTLYKAAAESILNDQARRALNAAPPLWVSLFSPRTARLFLELVRTAGLEKQLAACRAACLSSAVAEAASEAVWASMDVAPARTAESLAEMMARLSGEAAGPI